MPQTTRNPIESLALSVLESLGGNTTDVSAPTPERAALARDYYTFLNVSPTASFPEIQQALDDARSASTKPSFYVMQALENAESVLLNAELRARYDASLA